MLPTADDYWPMEQSDETVEWDFTPYLQAAAVLDAFDIFFWQPDLSTMDDQEGESAASGAALESARHEALLEQLLPLCEQILTGPLRGQWRMGYSERRAYLRMLASRPRMRQALDATADRHNTSVQAMFERVVDDKVLDLDTLTREDLAAMVTVIELLDGILEGLPDSSEVLPALARADLLAPMRRIVRNGFVNRTGELKQLRHYIEEKDFRPPFFVYGTGGVGKSTLVAQFILTQVDKEGYPFAYLDIDRPTLRPAEPLTFLLEIISQLRQQLNLDVNATESLIDEILNDIGHEEEGRIFEGAKGLVGYYFHGERLAEEVRWSLSSSNAPKQEAAIIFIDTFEEAQWFGPDIVGSLLDFLYGLHELKEFTVIISGRVLPEQYLFRSYRRLVTLPVEDEEQLQEELLGVPLPERPLNVNLLDLDASRELLTGAVACANLEPLTEKERDDIIEFVTPNPMCLNLAVRVLQNEGIDKLRNARSQFLAKLRAEKIQALLYGRILHHIKKEDVRKVAYPGLIVRRITPDVIREVLAGPCELELTVERSEKAIFEDMRREVSLVTYDAADKSLRHRPDVRRAMLVDLTEHVKAELVEEIDQEAVRFYRRDDDPASRAEEIYHRLRLGESRKSLNKRWLPEAANYLNDAWEELPAKQRLWLAGRLGITLDDDVRKEADQEAWEDQAERSANGYLASANAEKALNILEERRDRLDRSRLYNLHAEAYRILGSHDQALRVGREGVDALIEAGDIGQALDLLLKMVVVEESRNNLAAADSLLIEAENVAEQSRDPVKKLRTLITKLRIERKLRPEQEARQADLLRVALDKLDDDMLSDLKRRPVLLREAAAELAVYSPALTKSAIDTLGLETSTKAQAGALGQVLSVLIQQSDPATENDSDEGVFIDKWRSTDHDPIVIQDWVSAKGRDLASRLVRRAGQSAPGSDLLRELQAYFRAGEDIVLADVGKSFQAAGRSGEARKIYEQTLQTMRNAGDQAGEARTLTNLAEISRIESNPDQALDYLERALEIWREIGDRAEEARTMYDYAVLLLVLRRFDEAREQFNETLAIFRVLEDDVRVAMTLRNLGILYSESSELDRALDYFEEVVAVYRKLGDRSQEATTLNVMGEILRENDRLPQARQTYDEALALWHEVGDRSAEADTLVELAVVATAEGSTAEALELYERALDIVRALGKSEREAWILRDMTLLNSQTEKSQTEEGLESSRHDEESRGRMVEWIEIGRPFREALISGFNWNSLAVVLQYHANRRLYRLTSEEMGFDTNVDEVVDDAVRNGWLEMLAEGALAENPQNPGLNATVPHILAGVAAEGRAYYQGDVFEDSQRDPARQESDAHKPGASSTDQPIIYQVSGDLVYGNKTEGDDISVGSITDSEGIAIGRGSSASVGERKSEAVDSKSSGGQEPGVRQLQRQLVDQFNLEELKDLCFTLEVDFENLGGTGKSAKARELVLYMQRRGQLDLLNEAIQQSRG